MDNKIRNNLIEYLECLFEKARRDKDGLTPIGMHVIHEIIRILRESENNG